MLPPHAPTSRREVEQRVVRCCRRRRLGVCTSFLFLGLSLSLPSPMLGRKTDNKRVMTPDERERGERYGRRMQPCSHISTGRPPLISIEVMKKIASMILAFVSKGTSTGSLLTAGRSRFQYYCREFKGRARRPQQKVAEGGRWLSTEQGTVSVVKCLVGCSVGRRLFCMGWERSDITLLTKPKTGASSGGWVG